MKTNAIIRIVLYSVVIVLLLGILCAPFAVSRSESAEYSIAAIPLETESGVQYKSSSASDPVSATVIQDTSCYATPTADANTVAALLSGDSVQITRQENVNGKAWAYITSPASGWVPMACLSETALQSTTAPTIEASIADGSLRIPADQVSDIEIEWAAGSILIQPADVEEIAVSESEVSDAKYAMVYKLKGSKLSIDFCEETVMNFIGINTTVYKDLTILVPRNWACNSLEVDAASATLEVRDLTIREVDIDTASGTCDFANCNVDTLDLDTASGDVTFSGSLSVLECDAASASFYGYLSNTPSRMDMDFMSGDLDITLPADAGFTARIDAMNSDFSSDFPTTTVNGNHVCGDGSCRINVSGMSGDVIIRQAAAAAGTHPEEQD